MGYYSAAIQERISSRDASMVFGSATAGMQECPSGGSGSCAGQVYVRHSMLCSLWFL